PFGPLDALPVVKIEPTDLPPAPPGFVAADVAALADQVVVMAQRGLDERVWTASPHIVVDHVLGDLPPGATSGYEAATTETHGRVISWLIADSFDAELLPIGPPRVLARQWSAEAVSAADGTPALQVE